MMRRRLVLHIGYPKTGTTALQNFLFHNRNALASDGWLYPKAGLGTTSHYHLSPLFPRRQMSMVTRFWSEMFTEVQASGIPNVLISSEFFAYEPPELLKELIGNMFDDVQIICYVRRIDLLLHSAFNQFIRQHRYVGDIHSLSEENLMYGKRICAFASVFSQDAIRVKVYEKQQMPNGLFTDFLATIGISKTEKYDNAPAAMESNRSLPADLLFFFRHCNLLPLMKNESALLNDSLCAVFENNKQQFPFFKLLSPKEARSIIDRYADGDSRIARTFLSREDGRLFFDPLPDPDGEYLPYPGLDAQKEHFIFNACSREVREILEQLDCTIKNREPGQRFLPKLPVGTTETLEAQNLRLQKELARVYGLLNRER